MFCRALGAEEKQTEGGRGSHRGFFFCVCQTRGAAFKQASGPVADSGENTFHTQTEGGLCCGCTPPCTSRGAVHTTRERQRQNGRRRHRRVEPWRGQLSRTSSFKNSHLIGRNVTRPIRLLWRLPAAMFFFAPPFISKHPYIHTAIHHHCSLSDLRVM